MRHATSSLPSFRLAIAPGVPSLRLAELLALQRSEDPDVTIALYEVDDGDLVKGLHEGRYDAGLSLHDTKESALTSPLLWSESMAVIVPLSFPLPIQATLTISDLLDCTVFRWPTEASPLLDERLSSVAMPGGHDVRYTTSFELMALWVAAGYGVGLSAQSRAEHSHGWEIGTRALSDGPYRVETHLHRPIRQTNPFVDSFERRAFQIL